MTLILVSPLALLHAEDATTSTSTSTKTFRKEDRKEWRVNLQEKIQTGKDRLENLKQKVEVRREEMRTRFDEKRATVISDILGRLEKRFQETITKMNTTAARIQGRIDTLEQGGATLTEAQTNLDSATRILGDAQKALDAINFDGVGASTTATTTKASIQTIRSEFKALKELLKSAHTKLADAISSIKKGVSDGDKENNGQSDNDTDNR